MRAEGRLRATAPEVVAMQGVRTANLPDGGLGPASDAAATDGVVLGRLPRDHSYPRAVGRAAATPARAQLRDGLGAPPQATSGHGQPRARTAQGQGRGRRNLPGRSGGRLAGGPPTAGEGVDCGRGRSAG